MIKAFLALLLVAGFAFGDDDEHKYRKHHIPKDLSFLELSYGQYSDVKDILYEYKRDLKRFRHEKRVHTKAMRELFLEKDFDAKRYEELSREFEAKAVAIQAEFLKKLHPILTPHQRERFLYYFDEWDVD